MLRDLCTCGELSDLAMPNSVDMDVMVSKVDREGRGSLQTLKSIILERTQLDLLRSLSRRRKKRKRHMTTSSTECADEAGSAPVKQDKAPRRLGSPGA